MVDNIKDVIVNSFDKSNFVNSKFISSNAPKF